MSSRHSDIDPMIQAKPDAAAQIRQIVTANPGRRLPSERDLAAQLSISRVKLRSVFRKLQSEGLIESRRGSGTYGIDARARLSSVTVIVDSQIKLGDDPFFSRLVDLLQSALQQETIPCLIERTRGHTVPISRERGGVITIGQISPSVVDAPCPAVRVVALMPGSDVRPSQCRSVVTLENRDAGRDAARILIAQGCRTIVFAGRLGVDASEARFAGASEAAQDAGVTVELRETPLNYSGGLRLTETLKDMPEHAGVIAMNDWLAAGLRAGHAAAHSENRLPIVSFDGLPIAAEPSLHIVSLSVPLEEIARDAVSELQRLSSPRVASGRTLSYCLKCPN